MTIDCVTLATNHMFAGNPIAEQHRLRYQSIIRRQEWEVPSIENMEYDQYDNPATTYLIWRDAEGIARGVSRLYPTDRPFMLKDCFPHTATYCDIPTGNTVWEGSRFCIDNTLDAEMRKRIAYEIVLAYLQHGLANGINKIIGIMYPVYWNNLFTKNGWTPEWMGDVQITPDGKKSRAAILNLNQKTLEAVQSKLGIFHSIVRYGNEETYVRAA